MKLWKKRRIDAYEEVDYEPITVLEILREMKDLSELMVDLAYSALVLDSDPLGAEVEELEKRMDWLKYQLRIMSSLGVRTTDEAEQVAGILQIGDASEHIANAAADLVELMDVNIQLKPFLGNVLDEADDRISTQRIPAGSRGVGMTLGDMNLEAENGVRVLAIRRGKRWIYGPGKDVALAGDDVCVIRGQREGAAYFSEWLAGENGDTTDPTGADA